MTPTPTPVQCQGIFGLGGMWIRWPCVWGTLQRTIPSWDAWSIPKFLIWVRTSVSRSIAEYFFLSWKGINNLRPLDKSINSVEPKRPKLYPVFASAARVAVNNGRSVLQTLPVHTELLSWLLIQGCYRWCKNTFSSFCDWILCWREWLLPSQHWVLRWLFTRPVCY